MALSGVAAVVLTLALRPGPTASAQATQQGQAPTGLLAVAGQVTPDTYGLYLVDPVQGSVVVYEYVPSARHRLQLRAARTVTYDLQLESYSTEPEPSEIAEMVRSARRISETTTRPR